MNVLIKALKSLSTLNFGRRRYAFTLAEVLITLAVIGVVASMTIPALQASINEAQFEAALKTNYSALSAAATRIKNEDAGGTLKGFCQNVSDNAYIDCLAQNFEKYMSTQKVCLETNSTECWHGDSQLDSTVKRYNNDIDSSNTIYSHSSMILNNGAFLSFGGGYHDAACDSLNSGVYEFYSRATYNFCEILAIDVNGHKKPNQIGHDIYYIALTPDGIKIPDGFGCDKNASDLNGAGYSCAADVLIGK